MTLKRDRISIEVFEPSAGPETTRNDARCANAAMLALARLIGRQIAREQFERARARKRRTQRPKMSGELP